MTTRDDLLARAQAGGDIDGEPGVGSWTVSTEPMAPSAHPEGEVMVGRSVRLPLDVYQRIRELAEQRGEYWSGLVREWIIEGLARAESGEEPDPVVELRRNLDAATRALHALERRSAA